MIMRIKNFLRRFGLDIVKYHSFWDHIVGPLGIATILDIGANDGTFAGSMRAQFPDAHIVSFEPLEEAYGALTRRMQGDPRFSAYQVALGETSGEQIIHKSASNPSSSLLPMGELHKALYPHTAAHTDETIRVERLDDIAPDISLEKPILVKIDVQGFEAHVIRGGMKTLYQADIILVENSFVSLYEGQALFGEIHDLLREIGFSYRGRSETHYDPHTNAAIYEDSVFIKDAPAS